MASPFVWVPQQTILCNCKRFFKGTFSFLLFNCVFWGVNCGFLVSRDFNKLMYLPFGGKKRYFAYFLSYISLYIIKIVKKYIKINKIAFTKKRVLERPKIVKTFHHKKNKGMFERERETRQNQPTTPPDSPPYSKSHFTFGFYAD